MLRSDAGAARIVSLSVSPWRRDFTLAQEHRHIRFRVRNGVAGENGTRRLLETRDVARRGRLMHVAATYDHGRMALYVDGRMARSVGSDLTTVIGHSLKLRLPAWWEDVLLWMLPGVPIGVAWLLAASPVTGGPPGVPILPRSNTGASQADARKATPDRAIRGAERL